MAPQGNVVPLPWLIARSVCFVLILLLTSFLLGFKTWETKIKHELTHFDPPPAKTESDDVIMESRDTDYGVVHQLETGRPLLETFSDVGVGMNEKTRFHKCDECGKTIYNSTR